MDKRVAFVTGLGIGAGVMFMLDSDRGIRRRDLVQDQMTHISKTSREVLVKATRDLRNRATGLIAESKSLLTGEQVPDPVLVDRVRTALGRFPVHHRSIQVVAEDGRVMLSGETLTSELDTIIDAVTAVRGVTDVVNNLLVHETSEGISSLQGEPLSSEGARIH